MKYEWRKIDKHIYLPKTNPVITTLEPMNYITISGKGNPNSEEFALKIGALYQLAYGIRMSYKGEDKIDGYYEYTVFPLEGQWSLSPEGIEKQKLGASILELKDYFIFKIMIRQPEFVDEAVFSKFVDIVNKRKPNPLLKEVQFEEINEGLVCQMTHVGSYDSEPASFSEMEDFCHKEGYVRLSKDHKEIYVSDPSRIPVEKLKTTIRFKVSKK